MKNRVQIITVSLSLIFLVATPVSSSKFLWGTEEPSKEAPPQQIPPELYNDFTLQNSIPVRDWYRDDSYPPTKPIVFTPEEINTNLERVARKEQNYYGATDSDLYSAFEKYAVFLKGKTVAIIGSITPWYESIVLSYGGYPTTIEYNKIVSTDPRLEVLTVEEYEQNPKLFDVILSVSSLEHDGLGRYGDPINPNGDCVAMNRLKSMLKDNGLLFLSVPIGKDCIWWNVHRIYGRLRFPMLTKEWNIIDSFGFQDADLDCDRGMQASSYQPVFVLQKPQASDKATTSPIIPKSLKVES
ncbi:MAG: hypothetical protein JWO53_706 [Chlamydiia bacterium]|nr:hypothetical protein [Chlamydiia bacterium]